MSPDGEASLLSNIDAVRSCTVERNERLYDTPLVDNKMWEVDGFGIVGETE